MAVIGRIETLDETILQDAAPLPNWQSKYRLKIQIKRLIRGNEERQIVPATSISHAQLRDDRDFLMVLTPDGETGYTLVTAALWQHRPKLEKVCS